MLSDLLRTYQHVFGIFIPVPDLVIIRQVTLEDRPALERLFCELQEFERKIEPNRADPATICNRYVAELYAECSKHAGAFFVAELAGEIVGFVCVLARVPTDDVTELDREFAYITDLVVSEPHRRQGIAARLMAAAEAHAVAHGAKRVRISVLAANSVAHRLYQRCGYADNEVILEKGLDADRSHRAG